MNGYYNLRESDKEAFKRACNKLMSMCFINEKNESTRKDYDFITSHRPEFEEYLEILGYTLNIKEQYGVVQLINREGYNHARLKLLESIVLLILRMLYDEKKRELAVEDVVINVGDIHEKYLSLKIRDKQIDKTTMANVLQLLRRFNLIEILDRDISQEDARIIIYDSVAMAVHIEDIKRVNDLIGRYRKGAESYEDVEENEADKLASLP